MKFEHIGIYVTHNTYPSLSLITISSVTNWNLSPNILSSVGLTCLIVVVSTGNSILLCRNDNFLKIEEQKNPKGTSCQLTLVFHRYTHVLEPVTNSDLDRLNRMICKLSSFPVRIFALKNLGHPTGKYILTFSKSTLIIYILYTNKTYLKY